MQYLNPPTPLGTWYKSSTLVFQSSIVPNGPRNNIPCMAADLCLFVQKILTIRLVWTKEHTWGLQSCSLIKCLNNLWIYILYCGKRHRFMIFSIPGIILTSNTSLSSLMSCAKFGVCILMEFDINPCSTKSCAQQIKLLFAWTIVLFERFLVQEIELSLSQQHLQNNLSHLDYDCRVLGRINVNIIFGQKIPCSDCEPRQWIHFCRSKGCKYGKKCPFIDYNSCFEDPL